MLLLLLISMLAVISIAQSIVRIGFFIIKDNEIIGFHALSPLGGCKYFPSPLRPFMLAIILTPHNNKG